MKKSRKTHKMPKKIKTLRSKLFKDEPLRKVSFSRAQLIFFAAVFAAIGGYILWRSFAAPPAPPSITLYNSLDRAFAGESVQVVWKTANADSCHGVGGSGNYQGYVMIVNPDPSHTEGDHLLWTDNSLPTSGIARSDPLYDNDFGNQAGIFKITCTGGGGSTTSPPITVAYQPDSEKKNDASGAFNIHCESIPDTNKPGSPSYEGDQAHVPNFSHRPIDPIVAPGDPNTRDNDPPGHFHDFFGNKLLNENTNPLDLLNTLPSYRDRNDPNGWRNTSCNQNNPGQDPTQAGDSRNGSAYWVPSMYICDGGHNNENATTCDNSKSNFESDAVDNPWGVFAPNFLQIYYRNDSQNQTHESFPTGLKIISGPVWRSDFSDDTSYSKAELQTWKCIGGYLYTRSQADPDRGAGNKRPHCNGSQLIQIGFPNCWDGVRLDSIKDTLDEDNDGNTTELLWPANPSFPHNNTTGEGIAHRDHERPTCDDFTAPELLKIGELQGLPAGTPGHPRTLNGLHFEMRYEENYKYNNGNTGTLANNHVYWFALASRSEVPADQCDANGIPLLGRASPKKECWVTGFPECPLQYDVNPRQDLPITCAVNGDNNGSAPVYPKHLIDSAHADYFFGWDPLRLDFLTHECLNSRPECKGNHAGFGMPPGGPNCSDGFDNDSDGKTDWQADGSGDPNCTSPATLAESPSSAGRNLHFYATPTAVPTDHLATVSWSAEWIPINTGCNGSSSGSSQSEKDWNDAEFLSSGQDVLGPGTYTITCDPCNYGDHQLEECDPDPDPAHHLAPLVQTITIEDEPGSDQPPTIIMTAPRNGDELQGSALVSANAADDIGVAGVQFKLDGNNLGTEDTSSPYSITWDTTAASNGSHTLTAIAKDTGGHSTTAASVTVNVDNSITPPPGCPPDCPPPPPTEQFPVGDLNKDHHVDVLDLSILLSDYGGSDPVSDIDGQNGVDVIDLSILLTHYGEIK